MRKSGVYFVTKTIYSFVSFTLLLINLKIVIKKAFVFNKSDNS